MIKLMFLLLIALSISVMGQIHKTVKIWEPIGREILAANYTGVDSIYIDLLGQNSLYTAITDLMTIFYGTPNEFYTWCNKLETFSKENEPNPKSDFYIDIDGQWIYLKKSMGVKVLQIFEKNKTSAVHQIATTSLMKFRDKFTEWADKNNVIYK